MPAKAWLPGKTLCTRQLTPEIPLREGHFKPSVFLAIKLQITWGKSSSVLAQGKQERILTAGRGERQSGGSDALSEAICTSRSNLKGSSGPCERQPFTVPIPQKRKLRPREVKTFSKLPEVGGANLKVAFPPKTSFLGLLHYMRPLRRALEDMKLSSLGLWCGFQLSGASMSLGFFFKVVSQTALCPSQNS